jgi:hypothetical protein
MERRHSSYAELEAGLAQIECAPREEGVLDLIVRRPARGRREVLQAAELDTDEGLVGDRWARGARKRANQLTLMSSRVVALLARDRDRWSLAGDQLYVDLDLSADHLPPGTRLAIGTAEIEITNEPHTPCRQFRDRYGLDAVRFVGSPLGQKLNLRGLCAFVRKSGQVRVGDAVRVLFD